MGDYIEREAALSAVLLGANRHQMAEYIADLPAADVRPVVRGEWEGRKTFLHGTIVKCSLCGNFLDLDGVNAGRGNANFCPNCGADMRPQEEDE